MERDAGRNRKRSRHSAREEDPDGLGRKPLPSQHRVAANSCHVVLSVVGMGPPALWRRNEAFCDHVPDLPFGRSGELS